MKILIMMLAIPALAQAQHSATLTWEGTATYNVYRSEKGKFKKLNLQPITQTKFKDTRVKGGKKYLYCIKSVNGSQESSCALINATIPK